MGEIRRERAAVANLLQVSERERVEAGESSLAHGSLILLRAYHPPWSCPSRQELQDSAPNLDDHRILQGHASIFILRGLAITAAVDRRIGHDRQPCPPHHDIVWAPSRSPELLWACSIWGYFGAGNEKLRMRLAVRCSADLDEFVEPALLASLSTSSLHSLSIVQSSPMSSSH